MVLAKIDEVIHQTVRLQVMAALVSVEDKMKVDFSLLRQRLGLSDGNLAGHLRKLIEAGYVVSEKTFLKNRPRTYLRVTGKGQDAFEEHVATLKEIIGEGGRWKISRKIPRSFFGNEGFGI